jgi:hypothetical protein
LALLDDPEVHDNADFSLDEIEIYMDTDRRHFMAIHAEPALLRAAP